MQGGGDAAVSHSWDCVHHITYTYMYIRTLSLSLSISLSHTLTDNLVRQLGRGARGCALLDRWTAPAALASAVSTPSLSTHTHTHTHTYTHTYTCHL